jgi:hypothetical protein
VNIQDACGMTALHHFIQNWSNDPLSMMVLRNLMKAGANTEIRDIYNRTPLSTVSKDIIELIKEPINASSSPITEYQEKATPSFYNPKQSTLSSEERNRTLEVLKEIMRITGHQNLLNSAVENCYAGELNVSELPSTLQFLTQTNQQLESLSSLIVHSATKSAKLSLFFGGSEDGQSDSDDD